MNSHRKQQLQPRVRSLGFTHDCEHPSSCSCNWKMHRPSWVCSNSPPSTGRVFRSSNTRMGLCSSPGFCLGMGVLVSPFLCLFHPRLPLPLPSAPISMWPSPPACGDPLAFGPRACLRYSQGVSHFFSEESVRRQPQAIQLHMLLKVFGQERFE